MGSPEPSERIAAVRILEQALVQLVEEAERKPNEVPGPVPARTSERHIGLREAFEALCRLVVALVDALRWHSGKLRMGGWNLSALLVIVSVRLVGSSHAARKRSAGLVY